MSGLQRELTMGYDDPRLGGLLQQPVSTGGNAGIDWETMFPSLAPQINASRAAYDQQRNMVANNAGMEHLWPMFSQPYQYDPSGFPKQLIDSGQTTLADLVNQFNQKVSGNRLKLLPNGQVSFTQDVEASDPWGALVNGVLMAGVGAMSGGFGLADAMNGFGGAGSGFNPLADFGSDYFSGAGNYAGGLTDASWGVNPQGAGMDFGDFITNTFNPGDFTSSWLPGGDLSAYSGLGGIGGGMVDLGGAGAIAGAGLDAGSLSGIAQQLTQKIGETAAKSLLGKLVSGNATAADYGQLLGTLGATGLGILGANKQSDALSQIANQARADRAPFLNLATGWANNPASYYAGAPAQEAMKGVLAGLSVHGNPANNPTAMGLATEAGLRNWQNAVTGFGNLGLAGQDTRMALQSQAATADAGKYNALGYGLDQLTQPRNNLSDYLKMVGLA